MKQKPNISHKTILYIMTFPNFILAFLCYILFQLPELNTFVNEITPVFVDKLGGPTIFFIIYVTLLTIIAFAIRYIFKKMLQKSPSKAIPFVRAVMLQGGFNTIGVINLLIILNVGFEWVYMSGFLYAFLLEMIFIPRDYQIDNTIEIAS